MERDVVQILSEDHAVLDWLAHRLGDVPPGRVKTMLFNEFARTLGAHQTVIEQTVLPALKSCGWPGLTSELLAGHMVIKRLLAEALALRRDDPASDEAISRVLAQIVPQCDLEGRQLLPVLAQYLDEGQREMLAFDAEMHLAQLVGDSRWPQDESELAHEVHDLVEEAYVVLGSLPAKKDQPQM